MIGLSLTFDYEIYGDGYGSIEELIIKPTNKLIHICEDFDIKATLFVEVAELLKMKEIYYYQKELNKIEGQLKSLHKRGHDIQLHIHPWWFNAKFLKTKWELDYSLTSLCNLNVDDALKKILLCKDYLTELLKQTEIDYSCIAYRAGSWSMMPTKNVFEALTMAGIEIDSSVYKWGKLDTKLMKYDYTGAYSNIHPWFFSKEDVNKVDRSKSNKLKCLEVPIYAERKLGISFLTIKRILLMRKVRSVIIDKSSSSNENKLVKRLEKKFGIFLKRRSKKLDFCKCSFREMKKMIENVAAQNPTKGYLPVVAIGHSKDFIYWKDLERFLDFLRSRYSDVIEIVPLTTSSKKYLDSLI
jgi:peptidoglycan/xylan/chitin deacetylase (PgdA/CDA1 family)